MTDKKISGLPGGPGTPEGPKGPDTPAALDAKETGAPEASKTTNAPEGFRYSEVLRRGRPVHDPLDPFTVRHPAMPLSRRAKIFSPFDALRGFGDAITAKAEEHDAQGEPRPVDRK